MSSTLTFNFRTFISKTSTLVITSTITSTSFSIFTSSFSHNSLHHFNILSSSISINQKSRFFVFFVMNKYFCDFENRVKMTSKKLIKFTQQLKKQIAKLLILFQRLEDFSQIFQKHLNEKTLLIKNRRIQKTRIQKKKKQIEQTLQRQNHQF